MTAFLPYLSHSGYRLKLRGRGLLPYEVELSDSPYRGYWEERGYNNRADAGGPAFERRK